MTEELKQLPGIGSYVYDNTESKGWVVWDYIGMFGRGTGMVEFIREPYPGGSPEHKRMLGDDFRNALSDGSWHVTSQRSTHVERSEYAYNIQPKILYLMQGVPGSGKSTIAGMIRRAETAEDEDPYAIEANESRAVILSTDDERLEADGSYQFDPADNAKFHQLTQQKCAKLMEEGKPVIIVDNTNIQEWAAHPYIVMARVWGYVVQVVSVDCGLDTAIARQSERVGLGDRRVPDEVIAGMYEKMERLGTVL